VAVVYFVTLCIEGRRRVLDNAAALEALRRVRARIQGWKIHSAVLMPDHLHLLVAPLDREARLGNFTGAVKRWVRQELAAEWTWQPGCFDRLLRHEESLQQKWEYMRENPVRAGLVTQWQDWPWRIGLDEAETL
jgi:REP element-mobilizing transposase RayT